MKLTAYCRALFHASKALGLGIILLAPISGIAYGDNSKDKKENAVDDSFGADDSAKPNAPELPNANAEKHGNALLGSIDWQTGPGTGDLGSIAEIKIPAGYRFTGQDGARKFAELTQNIPSSADFGVLMPKTSTAWFIVFEYEDSGHVHDDEKTALDADKLLASLREGNEAANEERKSRNWPPMQLNGWKVPPAYEEGSHHLVWALRVASQGSESINYNTKILGRTGVMSAILVVDPSKFDATVGPSKELLAGFQFKSGSKYSEWRAGDKVAQYGLTGLITGGLVVGAAKFGLLSKLGILLAKFAKLIVVGVLVVVGAIGKFFGNIKDAIFGGRNSRSNR